MKNAKVYLCVVMVVGEFEEEGKWIVCLCLCLCFCLRLRLAFAFAFVCGRGKCESADLFFF